MKICKICNENKPHGEYTKHKKSKDGFAYYCNPCRAEYELQRRIKTGIVPKPKPKIVDNFHKECLKCHFIHLIDDFPISKRGRLGRGPYCIECNKEYHKIRTESPDVKKRIREATQKYRDSRREHWRGLHRVHQYNRKNKIKVQSDGTVTEEFMKELYATTHCHWCKESITPDKRTAEHIIPLANGGIHGISNLRMACLSCNSSKLNFI